MRKLMIGLVLCIIFISVLSAPTISAWSFDNSKIKKDKGRAGYDNIEIKNAFGLGSTLWKGELKFNTDYCGTHCSAEKEITIYERGSLIDDVKYETILEDGSRIEQPIRSYQFYTKVNNKLKKYKLGEIVDAGTYQVKLEGNKKLDREVDWIITSQGKEIGEWAVWSSRLIVDSGTTTIEGGFHNFSEVIVAAGATLTIGPCGHTLCVNNSLALFASTINISGTLNGDSKVGGAQGVGSGSCSGGTGLGVGRGTGGANSGGSSGGGGGASHNLTGGAGGAGPASAGATGPTYGNLSNLEFSHGSGGGGGGGSDGCPNGGAGGAGILLQANNIFIDGVVTTDGSSGGSNSNAGTQDLGGGGGGSGGEIVIVGKDVNITDATLTSTGGSGGAGGQLSGDAGGGGAGAGGLIKVFYEDSLDNESVSTTVVAGSGGAGIGSGSSGSGANAGVVYWEQGSFDIFPVITVNITLITPSNNFQTTSSNIGFNCSVELFGDGVLSNVSLFTNKTGTFELNNFTDITGTSLSNIISTNFSDGDYIWSCQFCDVDNVCGFATENRTITIDTNVPEIIINNPVVNIDYGYAGENVTLNWTVTDTNLDSCWFNYNGTNQSVSCSANLSSFILEEDNYNVLFYANDSVGNLNTINWNWEYVLFENSQTYTATAASSANEEFIINVTHDSSDWALINANLIYNNTLYAGTKSGSGDTVLFSRSLQIPSFATSTEIPFYWNFALTNGTGTYYYNSSSLNQTIDPIILIFCNSTYNTTTLNFTIKEAGTFDILNGSLEATFNYWVSGDGSVFQTYSYSEVIDNRSEYAFCISPPESTFMTDGTISYFKDGYDRREYLLEDYSISNSTENINLYLSTTATTDIFTFTVRDENDDPVSGAYVRVQRWDIGTDNFYTVGMIKTVSDGTGIINLRLNDEWYRYQVIYNDILYLTTDPVKETETSRTLEINLEAANPFDNFENIEFSLTYNNATNITLFTFADTTGAVQTGCLKVMNSTGLGNIIVYNSCVESTSGTLSYEIVGEGTYIIQAIIRLTSEYDSVERVIYEIVRSGTPTKFTIHGKLGSVISLLLVGTSAMVGIAAGSVPLGLGLIIAALIATNLFGWLNITSSVLYGLISIVILIALNLRRNR